MSHRQAFYSSGELTAASPSLGPAALAALAEAQAGGDGLKVIALEGLGMVAARSVDGFSHVVVGLPAEMLGIELWDAPHWREDAPAEPRDLPALEPGPLDLARARSLLADAPPGVAAALLDAVLSEAPVVLAEPDEERRAAWIAWVSFALPRAYARRLTFTTSGRADDVRISATAHADEGAIDATRPFTGETGLYARVAAALDAAALTRALRLIEEPDAVALAVAAGTTELIEPADLRHALERIADLARRGHVAEAARAAGNLPREPRPEPDDDAAPDEPAA